MSNNTRDAVEYLCTLAGLMEAEGWRERAHDLRRAASLIENLVAELRALTEERGQMAARIEWYHSTLERALTAGERATAELLISRAPANPDTPPTEAPSPAETEGTEGDREA